MANTKISALTSATTPLVGTEVLPIVQSGATVKVANNDLRPKQIQSNATTGVLQVAGPGAATTRVMTTPDANFTAARTDAAQSFTGDQTLSTGNIIQGTAAKGVNFTANTPAAGMTSQLLNWYEEGTFTPTLTTDGTNFTSVTYITQLGNYTRVGRAVSFSLNIYTSAVTKGSASGNVQIGGLPFVQNGSGIRCSPTVGQVLLWAIDSPSGGEMQDSSAKITLLKRALVTGSTSNSAVADVATGAGNFIRMSGTYFV